MARADHAIQGPSSALGTERLRLDRPVEPGDDKDEVRPARASMKGFR